MTHNVETRVSAVYQSQSVINLSIVFEQFYTSIFLTEGKYNRLIFPFIQNCRNCHYFYMYQVVINIKKKPIEPKKYFLFRGEAFRKQCFYSLANAKYDYKNIVLERPYRKIKNYVWIQ